ncbi:cupin domain-containing protein [Methanogenium organophilum]|uniref:Cupin domain-containing protein n=1 Tax=Methanogenium organophilum TaxID=2199 RepID=A0A9X9S541_METOG|nr:cupin domain-containing protein [Methanogenium organophilum]WAI02089.1 cupin domain-containing protein [Methanogenium organophilum]
MIIRDLAECPVTDARDGTHLCELLHPSHFSGGVGVRFSLAHAYLEPGEVSYSHRLTGSHEVYYILSGTGVMHIGGETEPVCAGQAVYIPVGAVQYIENTGVERLIFLAIVDPMWVADGDERVG